MGRIHTGVFAVIALYDRYLGMPVKGGQVKVFVKPEMRVLYKEGGYVVLLRETGVEKAKVTLRSEIFQERMFLCGRQEEPCVQAVWMEPRRNYPFSSGTVFLKGKVREGAYLTFEKEERTVRLTADCEKGQREIQMYGLPRQVKGTEYVFWQDEKPVSEIFEIADLYGDDRSGEFVSLKSPLKRGFRKKEAEVRRVYPVLRDKEGAFFMAFDLSRCGEGNRGYVLVDGAVEESFFVERGLTG